MSLPSETPVSAAQATRQQRGRHSVLSLSSGLLLALAFSTHSTGWLVWVALMPWFYVLFSQPLHWRRGAWYGWIFGMGFYIGTIHWLKELHPLTWLQGVTEGSSLMIVYGGILGISLVVSLWTVLLGGLLGLLKPSGFRQVIYPAILWMGMEHAQALGEISLPWARLALSQYQNLWLLQIIPYTGQLLIAGLIVAFNAALTWFVIDFVPDKKPKAYWYYPGFRALLIVLSLVGLNLAYGASRLQNAPSESDIFEGDVSVGLIQGNIPQGQKWSTADEYWQNMQQIYQTYADLSSEALKLRAERPYSLLIWPESALPTTLRQATFFHEPLEQLSRSNQSYLLTGIFDRPDAHNVYNAAILFEPDGRWEQWYYKRHLVPFGEFFPYRETLGALPVLGALIEQLNPLNSDTTAGTAPALLQTPFAQIGTLICFESVYPQVARESVRAGANLLVIITNDGWYRDAIALYQHLGHAVLRALENGRPVLRAGNTGISAVIDTQGRILQQTLPMEADFLSWQLNSGDLNTQQTLYTRWGEWPLGLALLLLLGLELRKQLRPRRTQSPQAD